MSKSNWYEKDKALNYISQSINRKSLFPKSWDELNEWIEKMKKHKDKLTKKSLTTILEYVNVNVPNLQTKAVTTIAPLWDEIEQKKNGNEKQETDKEEIPDAYTIASEIIERENNAGKPFYIPKELNKDIYLYENGCFIEEPNNYVEDLILEYFIENDLHENLTDSMQNSKIRIVKKYIRKLTKCSIDDFDTEEYLIPLKDCCINFEDPDNIKILEHSPEFKNRHTLSLKYNPNAKCPKIDKLLSEIFHESDIELIHEILGYCLTKWVKYQVAFLLYGKGNNGKTTFCILVTKYFIGEENSSHADMTEWGQDNTYSQMANKLVNVVSDANTEKRIDIARVKGYIGAESKVKVNKKYKNVHYVSPTAKQIHGCNDDFPNIPESADKGLFRKWIPIEFPNTFDTKENVDILKQIVDEEELSGLLNHALEGLKRLMKRGHFAEEYRDWQDTKNLWLKKINPFMSFIEECCTIGEYEDAITDPDNENWELKDDTFTAYNTWRIAHGHPGANSTTKITQWIKQNPKFSNTKRKIEMLGQNKRWPIYSGFKINNRKGLKVQKKPKQTQTKIKVDTIEHIEDINTKTSEEGTYRV